MLWSLKRRTTADDSEEIVVQALDDVTKKPIGHELAIKESLLEAGVTVKLTCVGYQIV